MPTAGFSHTAVSYSRGAGGAHYTDLLPSPPAQNKNSLDASALLQREPLRIQNHAPNSSPSSSAILAELVRCTTRSVESRCCAYLFVQISTHSSMVRGDVQGFSSPKTSNLQSYLPRKGRKESTLQVTPVYTERQYASIV